jgi:hypothetical protein
LIPDYFPRSIRLLTLSGTNKWIWETGEDVGGVERDTTFNRWGGGGAKFVLSRFPGIARSTFWEGR